MSVDINAVLRILGACTLLLNLNPVLPLYLHATYEHHDLDFIKKKFKPSMQLARFLGNQGEYTSNPCFHSCCEMFEFWCGRQRGRLLANLWC
jgi:hypothetical protein